MGRQRRTMRSSCAFWRDGGQKQEGVVLYHHIANIRIARMLDMRIKSAKDSVRWGAACVRSGGRTRSEETRGRWDMSG